MYCPLDRRPCLMRHPFTHTLNIYTSDLPPSSAPVQVMVYADDITSTSAATKYIQPYIQKVFAWTKQKNLTLNPGKTTCTLFMPDTAEYTSNLELNIHNNALPMATHPKVWGITLDPKLTPTTSQYTHTNLYKS